MMIPIRCISCGTPVSGKWEKFKDEIGKGKAPGKAMDELGVTRYCCRSLFLTHVDTIDQIARFRHRMVAREEVGELKEHGKGKKRSE